MIKLVFLLLYFSNTSHAEDQDLCKYFKYCGGSSRKSSQSLPSSASAGNLNPGNISSVKGLGIETLYQPKNPLTFAIVTGNGRIGALVSPTLENSFFGNRSIEIDELLLARKLNKIQYENKKINLAIGAKILDKKNIGLDIGVSVKRNPQIKKINPGVGLSARFSFLNFGAYFYQDDVKVDLGNYVNPYTNILYSTTHQGTTYQEKFSVETYTVGTKIKSLSLDYGLIKTRYKFYQESTRISLYSSSYSYNSFLFNLALRKEDSPNLDFENGLMVIKRKKADIYYGAQYLVNHSIVVGLQYNNFLLHEWSATLTIFI
ncbi:MAG: hypothetical protein PHY93_10175 [Bacteriovorax sp.]|nr:hypothetical protein [Bacteriovorax sp.]